MFLLANVAARLKQEKGALLEMTRFFKYNCVIVMYRFVTHPQDLS